MRIVGHPVAAAIDELRRPVAALGEGGIERWNSSPIVLWLAAYGSHVLATGPARQS